MRVMRKKKMYKEGNPLHTFKKISNPKYSHNISIILLLTVKLDDYAFAVTKSFY